MDKGEWCLGVEWFRNDSEKEFDGIPLLKGSSAEALVEMLPMAIEHMPGFADQVEANIKAGKVNPTRVVTDVPTWIRSNLIWYHLFHQPTLARMRQNMFDADPNQEHVERSFEEVMAESSEPLKMLEQIPEHDRYFNFKGEEINGLPDFWALQAGLV
jgi:hypothetical protein